MVRRGFLATAVALLPLAAPAAAPAPRRIGLLHGATRQDAEDWIREIAPALRKLGWTDERLVFVVRAADGDSSRNDALAAELAALGVDILTTGGTPRTHALQRATRTIPIVTSLADPVRSGFARSIAAPGANVTGLAFAAPEAVNAKQVQLIKRCAPAVRRIAFLYSKTYGYTPDMMWPGESAARGIGLAFEALAMGNVDDFARAFANLRQRGGAILANFAAEASPAEIARLAIAKRVPTMFSGTGFVEAGGLMSYMVYHDDEKERLASIVDRILRGASPASIPFELPTRSMMEINRATARAIGLDVPRDLLLQADQVYG